MYKINEPGFYKYQNLIDWLYRLHIISLKIGRNLPVP